MTSENQSEYEVQILKKHNRGQAEHKLDEV